MSYDLAIFQLRGTAAQLKATDETPVSGRLCKETDLRLWKIGDGSTTYNALPYVLLDGEQGANADVAFDVVALSDSRDGNLTCTVNGVAQTGIATFTGVTDGDGRFEINLTDSIPNIISANLVSAVGISGSVCYGFLRINMITSFSVSYYSDAGNLADSNLPVSFTIVYTTS